MHFPRGTLGFTILIAVLHATAAAAQVQTLPPTFEFSFSNPGARSMGFGGAFVALADDATAAFANPAGLVQLTRSEVAIEARTWDYSTPYVAGGRIFGTPTGHGLDSSPGLRTGESSARVSGLSFLSLVYPRETWSFALHRHQLANFRFAGRMEGLYSGPWPGVTPVRREWDYLASTDFEIWSTALASAVKVNDALSLGLSLIHFESSLRLLGEFYGRYGAGFPDFYERRDFGPDLMAMAYVLDVDDTDWRLAVGLLWSLDEHWKLGAFYRMAPVFRGSLRGWAGATNPDYPPGTLIEEDEQADVPLPDVYGLGLSYRHPNQALTFSLEWDRVEYSVIYSEVIGLTIPDGDELRLGGEYVFLRSAPLVALRLGAWRDPDHRARYTGDHYVAAALFSGGDDEVHLTGGVGLAFERFQVDLAVDVSESVNTASLSVVYSL